jgi:Cdc6-like AAA superfamily ATPase
MAKRLQPRDVFTPASWADPRVFATRRHLHLQDRVESALAEKGRQVVLFGQTGVGKTSLVHYICTERNFPYVRVECGEPFEDMIREALGLIVRNEEIESIQKQSAEAEVGVTLWGLLTGKAKKTAEKETKFAKYAVSLPTTLAEACRIMKVRVLFLDNFENLAAKSHHAETASDIVQLMKSVSDRSAVGGAATVKVVVAGIPTASEELLELDVATERRIKQIEVPKMTREELDEIVRNGERTLSISFEGFCRDRILQFSDGFPYYTHLFALHASTRAVDEGRTHVTIDDFDHALEEIVADCSLSLKKAYNRAVETSGDLQMRKSVMEALASVNDTEVPFKRIREAFMDLHPGKYKDAKELNFLSTAMKPLKEDYNILIDKNLPRSKNNAWSFANPLMRAYVNLRALQERQQQLDLDAAWQEVNTPGSGAAR